MQNKYILLLNVHTFSGRNALFPYYRLSVNLYVSRFQKCDGVCRQPKILLIFKRMANLAHPLPFPYRCLIIISCVPLFFITLSPSIQAYTNNITSIKRWGVENINLVIYNALISKPSYLFFCL